MMKVSDPVIFGHVVKVFFADVFAKHADTFERLGVNANDGLAAPLDALEELPADERAAVRADSPHDRRRPDLAMVDSDRGITNLHVPSDVIVDASMPAMIRTSGHMERRRRGAGHEGGHPRLQLRRPLRRDHRVPHRQRRFDPTTMGSVPNVGLMAQAAEEYGSHDKTFEVAAADGVVAVVNSAGETIMSHEVEAGDIWRMCQAKDAPSGTG